MKNQIAKASKCFPKFKKIKDEEKNWLEKLYLKDDIHLTEEGNRIVADEIKANLF